MSKQSVTRMWIAGLIVLVAGLAVGGISLGLMLANGGTWTPAPSGNGSDFVPTLNAFFWTTIGFMIAGFTVAIVGSVIQLAAWIGALINTYQLADKAWFIVLLVGGLVGLVSGLAGFAVMVAYLVAGPDALPHGQPSSPPIPQAPREPYQEPYAPREPQPAEYAQTR